MMKVRHCPIHYHQIRIKGTDVTTSSDSDPRRRVKIPKRSKDYKKSGDLRKSGDNTKMVDSKNIRQSKNTGDPKLTNPSTATFSKSSDERDVAS